MKEMIPRTLSLLAENAPEPLYVVGGAVRDRLAGLSAKKRDIDLSSPMPAELFARVAEDCGITPVAVYRNTGTVKLRDDEGNDYEYTCFRSDKYVRGTHRPAETFFTKDISSDAKRRDFTVNAIYYDVAADRLVDPLDGRKDVGEKRLRTVDDADKVFGEDGLRLMRLARQAGQLGFSPSEECLSGARHNAALILDISPERIFTELVALLHADEKYGVKDGAYRGLKILDETRVLDFILPELTEGRGVLQRKDFHKYDMLEHSLRAVKYADGKVRLAALLHDAGKPFCFRRDGNVHEHAVEGARIAEEILARLRAPKKTTERVKELVLFHMYDFDLKTGENKLRRFFVRHAGLLEELSALKQADFSACADDLSESPTTRKWKAILAKMKEERAPFCVKELAVTGKELEQAGIERRFLSVALEELLLHCAVSPKDNEKNRLLALAPALLKEKRKREGDEARRKSTKEKEK